MLPVINRSEAMMARGAAAGCLPDIHHPEVMRGVLERMLAAGDVLGRDRQGRTLLAAAIDDWLLDELVGFGADLADLELEPDENHDSPEDEEA
jgi:hypothetical protein